MELLDKFLKETRNGGCLYSPRSFITYSQPDSEHIYIEDIYVEPSLREYHLATKLADMVCDIGRTRNCKYAMGAVDRGSTKIEQDIKVLEAYGMSEWKTDEYFVYYRKEL